MVTPRAEETKVARHVRLTFTESGVSAVARLYDDLAPDVCAAMWQALEVPLEGPLTHAMASGEELMINMPEANRRFDPAKVPTQMATIHPRPGELLWTYLPPFYMEDFGTGLWDFIIVYGQCVLTSRETGPLICSRWARIEDPTELAAFAKESARTYTEGQKPVRVERIEA
jgi:hypothetical protein